MRILHNISLIAICTTLATAILSGCDTKKDNTGLRKVNIDINQASDFNIEPPMVVSLETNDSSLIYDIENMIVADGKFFIKSRDLLKFYNASDGQFLGNLATIGEGPGEYLFVNRLWNTEDTIHIFDSMSKKVNSYDSSGKFLATSVLFENAPKPSAEYPAVNFVIEAPDGDGFYSINTWMGGVGDPVPAYSRYNAEDSLEYLVKGRFLNTGSYGYSRAAIDRQNNRILIWENCIDTLFAITDSIVRPVYAFDYGKYSVPQDIQRIPDMFERMLALKNMENCNRIITAQYFTPVHEKIIYSIMHYNKEDDNSDILIVTIDQNDASAGAIRLIDSSGHYKPQACIHIDGNYLYVALRDMRDEEANPAIARLPLSAFL